MNDEKNIDTEDLAQLTAQEIVIPCPEPVGSVTMRELPLCILVQVLPKMSGLIDAASTHADWNVTQAVLRHGSDINAALALAVGNVSEADFSQLPASVTITLVRAFIEVHRSFFFQLAILEVGMRRLFARE